MGRTAKGSIRYEVRLVGLETPEGKISASTLLEVLKALVGSAERGLRLAIEGSSVKPGRLPAWLEHSVNFTIAGLKKGSTIVVLEAPLLEATIGQPLSQQDFWIERPSAQDTALTLLSNSVRDATAEDMESEYYDAGLLSSLAGLKQVLLHKAETIEIKARARPEEVIRLNLDVLAKVERLRIRTPDAKTFVVAGLLNQIEHSEKRFTLVLRDGQIIKGRIDEATLTDESLRKYWGKNVSIKGLVHFRPNGRPKMIEAHLIKLQEEGEQVFEQLPLVQTDTEFVNSVRSSADHGDWINAIWAKWPGDEPIEELLQELKR